MCNEKCLVCPYSLWEHVETHHSIYKISCKNMNGKVIDETFNIELNDDLDAPSWCPKKLKNTTPCYDKNMLKKWEMIEPKIAWSDIKKDKIYHLPPYNTQKRCDIKILSINSSFLRYEKINTHVVGTLYPSQIGTRLMVEKHN